MANQFGIPVTDYGSMGGWGGFQAEKPNYLSLDPLQTSALPANSYGLATSYGNGMNTTLGGNWGASPVADAAGGGGLSDFLGGMFGTTKNPGWGGQALGAAQGIFSGWLGMQQYGLAKQKLAESKRQFDVGYEAQKTTMNSELEDRQRARVASNAGAYQSVGDYMGKNGIK